MSEADAGDKAKPKKPTEQNLLFAFEEGLDTFEAKMQRMWEPYWNERKEVLKTIISLASGSVALAVTFSNNLLVANAEGTRPSAGWRFCLASALALFILTIILSIISLLCARELKATLIHFLKRRERIRATLSKVTPETLSEPLMPIVREVLDLTERNDKRAERFFQASLAAFTLALFLLVLFGFNRIGS